MHKLILEVCGGNQESLWEPVFLENLNDLPMGVKQAVEDFIDAHDGKIATPIMVTARAESDPRMPCFPFFKEASPAHRRGEFECYRPGNRCGGNARLR